MKLLTALPLMIFCFSTKASDFKKINGTLSLYQSKNHTAFSINSSLGTTLGVCEIGGELTLIDARKGQRNRWVYSDQSSMCVVLISELDNGAMQVISKDCDNHCSVTSLGSINGTYNK
ncbi:acyl-CoA dehydrogenase [Enterobacter hormaechei]|uniref:acyl-CoA dehydrogenase n=1 Tax=Enterobacter hormaechei TaxID=158836 RepID=UPI001C94C1C7|nr:acyl-CoA dehydrogenase [Enterobacter hormaechei]MBY5176744.1 acyl-CoA dehydrogenase [Enterobacter hormaechei]MBY5224455.1 acyl-CoA dehydrogenase [Enterobacter hormaechei]MCV2294833.1 acyl-CoA dehydrogenase [Enterobacter hormaechei]MCV2299994.1 acyl-CoA dehydrogenase [Enterobacter hormaechei]MCV2304296.1 acyl-CoA dehydrogenase [Enterobacter hormaechei]